MGFQLILVFFVVEKRRERQKIMITGISGFGFCRPKMPFRDAYLFFRTCLAETPIFIVFWGCALFGPSCQKKRNFGHPPKTKEKFD